MKVWFAFAFLFFLNLHIGSTQNSLDQISFPESWRGEWKGTLEIYNAQGLLQSLSMALSIFPIDNSDRYTWTIYYGEDTLTGKRDYELVPIDTLKGIYSIDEKNSIQMEGYLIGGKYFRRCIKSNAVRRNRNDNKDKFITLY